MPLLSLLMALILTGLLSGVSWAVSPAPWAGGPSGERSVIGGRSIRKPGVPAKMPPAKGTVGTLEVIAIRAQFTDVSFDPLKDKVFFEGVLSDVARYYSDVSGGMLTLNFTVSDTVYPLSQPMSYYGDETQGGADALIIDAVQAADPDIDFSLYDAVIVIHAGVGEESLGQGDTPAYIWSQRVSFPPISVDGVDVSGGVVVPEKEQGVGSSIVGAVAHEFGHELGLPDLYDVDGTSRGIGRWGLMGTGSWGNNGATPSEFMAWSKIFLGWASVTLLSSDQIGYPLLAASGNQVVKVNARGYPDSEEYFLLENRRQAPGSWDEFLPGEGLLIWHVDEAVGLLPNTGLGCPENRWVCNEVNADESHKFVDLEEAEGPPYDLDNNVNSGDAQDPFLFGNVTSFTGATTPGSNNYALQDTGISVTSVSSPGDTMTFDLSLGFHVKSVSLVSANTVDVEYNRAANAPTASNYTLFSIDGTNLGNPASAALQGDGVTARLSFTSPIVSSDIYRLTAQNESDAGFTLLQFNPTTIDNPFGTNAAGALNGHAVWDAAGSPYYITDNLIIENHLSLTINEGAVVKIKMVAPPDQIDIIVYGLLRVLGSEANPVLISSAGSAPGDWGTIRFRSEADDSSVISHAVIEYGTRGLTLSSASPSISASTFRNFSDRGIILFGDSSPSITGNTFSQNVAGIACWENSTPRIIRNLITGNDRGVICGNSANPTITGNSFDGNSEIGLAVSDLVGTLNPTVVGNNFINHSASGGTGIYTWDNPVNAPHNYFSNNYRDVWGMNTSAHIGLQLSQPIDWQFSPSTISFKNSGYTADVLFISPDSPLRIQLEGTGSDASLNSAIARVKSSVTDTTGILVHLNETGGTIGIYRTASNPETLASIGTSTDQSVYRLGAGVGETLTAVFPPDVSVATSAVVFQCMKGDADGGGWVDISDVIYLLRVSIGIAPQPQTTEQRCLQDVDESGLVNILDAIEATRILLNL